MKEITPQEVQQLLADKQQMHLIDVRETDEVESGKIPSITHIPLGLLEFKLQDLDKNTPYIMVCRSGGRSGRAVQILESHGYQATNMVGGMLAWDGPIE
ncbi:rhodanese-like domain-containing protein [Sporosarcina aquimarina]|uniref:Rhodanese-like domain-containing protein n=1 Tax=Sporosarcina aquimarina TaxID=114975 RepID=A0ABU4FVS9_9BACL|nr:rhodanese-like domain-containing protein [Sporosarcina aquimarina]MDW0108809.1 rhodanese-like domain-containing protein [Sporosarcina aquimarina]